MGPWSTQGLCTNERDSLVITYYSFIIHYDGCSRANQTYRTLQLIGLTFLISTKKNPELNLWLVWPTTICSRENTYSYTGLSKYNERRLLKEN